MAHDIGMPEVPKRSLFQIIADPKEIISKGCFYFLRSCSGKRWHQLYNNWLIQNCMASAVIRQWDVFLIMCNLY